MMIKKFALLAFGAAISLYGANSLAAVGRTVGHFQVSAAGSAHYSIPIFASPGPGGLQPNVSLFYDSNAGIGPLGVGWSLGGLGQISRCNKTVAQDTTPAAVALVSSDGYCINGSRMRLTSGTYGAAGSVYQTEIADFSQIIAYGTAGNGPEYFTVQGRNGLTYYYGYTDANGHGVDSEVLASGTSTALTWLLSKVVDRSGNNYVINYTTLSGKLSGVALPAQILWTPAGANSSTYNYTMQFNYSANVPQSSVTKYVAGSIVSNPELLSSIEVLSGSTVVKDYFLTYSASPTTGRDELTSIQECPTTAQSNSSCLAATSVAYAGPAPGVSSTATAALSSSGTKVAARYDLNGDGIPDIIYNNGSYWYVSFGSASGYGTPVSTGISSSATVLPGNLNAGLEDGLLATIGGTWYYYTWNGTSFVGKSTGLAVDSTAAQYQLADVNGDGLPDLVALYVVETGAKPVVYQATIKTRLNATGSSSSVSFSSTLNSAYVSGDNLSSVQLSTPDDQYGALRRFDFNGDGMDDLVLVYQAGSALFTDELISTGTSFTATVISNGYSLVLFANFNDDACTDVIIDTTLYIAGCNGSIPLTFQLAAAPVAAIDWDGDGRTDIVVPNGSTLGVYLSTSSGLSSLISTSVPYSSSCQYVRIDANGRGLDDLGCWSQLSSNAISYYSHNAVPDLATKFTDGFGNSASPTYVTLTSRTNYSQYTDATYPYLNYIGPLYVVDTVSYSDPSSQSGTDVPPLLSSVSV